MPFKSPRRNLVGESRVPETERHGAHLEALADEQALARDLGVHFAEVELHLAVFAAQLAHLDEVLDGRQAPVRHALLHLVELVEQQRVLPVQLCLGLF